MSNKEEILWPSSLCCINDNAGAMRIHSEGSLDMLTKKSDCAVQAQHNLETQASSLEDPPDSPLSCEEKHVTFWDKSEETVLWSNAAFRSCDTVDDFRSSTTSLRSSTCSINIDDISATSAQNAAQLTRIPENNNSPSNFSSEKFKLCECHALGTPNSVPVKNCACRMPMEKVQAELNSSVTNQSLPLENVSRSKSQLNRKIRTMPELGISEEEAKIKVELEKEIEKGLEEEIKDGILILSRRLAELHARQKARKEGYLYQRSNVDTPLRNNHLISDYGAMDSFFHPWANPKLPCYVGITPLPLSSSRQTKSPVISRRFRSPVQKTGDGKDSEKKFQKEFDWVRTLRSGTKASISPNELNPSKKPSCTVPVPERFRCNSPNMTRKCSRALFPESKKDTRRSISEPRITQQRHNDSNLGPKEGNAKSNVKGTPKEDSCSTGHSGVCRKMDCRKANVAVKETKGAAVIKAEKARDVNPKRERIHLIDMMNKLRVSDTNNCGEQRKKESIFQ